jgi:dipeptidyl aminopeptidase/acylaminoacyl peptidase
MSTRLAYAAAAVALAAAGCGSNATSAARRTTPMIADGAQVHPHGLLLVQTCPAGTSDGDVYIVDAATGRKRFVVRAGYSDEPRWSPDGRRVLVARGRDFWVYPVRHGRPTNVTRMHGWSSNARWSPDATRIAFIVGRGTRSSALYVLRVGGRKPRLVVRHVDAVAWSPKGGMLAFAPESLMKFSRSKIWTVPARGGRPKPFGGDGAGSVWDISWGKTQLLWYSSGGAFWGEEHLIRAGRDHKLRENEGELQFLANGSYVFTRGARIVFSDGRRGGRFSARAVAPAWSPDGSYVAYTNWGLDKLYVARGDGSGRRGFGLGLSPICNIGWQPFSWVE